MPKKPIIAVTMGDPAGVGPETIVGAWANPALHEICRPLVVGHPQIMRRAVELLSAKAGVVAQVQEIGAPAEASPTAGVIPCLAACDDSALEVPPAAVSARGGRAAYDALLAATRLALAGEVDAITTAPLNKLALWKAGHKYPATPSCWPSCAQSVTSR